MLPIWVAGVICGVGGFGLLYEALVLRLRRGAAMSGSSLSLLTVGGVSLLALGWLILSLGVGTANAA